MQIGNISLNCFVGYLSFLVDVPNLETVPSTIKKKLFFFKNHKIIHVKIIGRYIRLVEACWH